MTAKKPLEVRVQEVAAALGPQGAGVQEISEAIGVQNPSRLSIILTTAVKAGVVFQALKERHRIYFKTAEQRDALVEAEKARKLERLRAHWRIQGGRKKRNRQAEIEARAARRNAERERREQEAAQRKAMKVAEAEIAKQRRRLEREAEQADKLRAKAEAKKTKQRLRAETKAAGLLKFKPGTDSPKPQKPAWAAMPAHNPNNIQPVILESNLNGRFAANGPVPSVVNSRECRSWVEAIAA